jgi:nucleoside-diphosphate-sugar epimerase
LFVLTDRHNLTYSTERCPIPIAQEVGTGIALQHVKGSAHVILTSNTIAKGGIKMKILITGGAGNIGRELTRRFIAEGNEVVIFDIPQANFEGLYPPATRIEGLKGLTIVKGSVTDADAVEAAVKGVDAVIHLAALMPDFCTERQETMLVNVGGTKAVLDALDRQGRDVNFVYASSVSIYGWTLDETQPIKIDHRLEATDLYAESKIAAEKVIMGSNIPNVILRLSGVVIPRFYDPNPWQFLKHQRVEFVARDDVITALYNSAVTQKARNKIINVAGGGRWRMIGGQWAEKHMEAIGFSAEDAEYSEQPGWFDWYDTEEGQAVLEYQNTTPEMFLSQLSQAVEEFNLAV